MTKFMRTAKQAKDSRGQVALVLAAIALAKTPETAMSTDEVAAAIKAAGLKTVQTPRRIAAYYLAILKKTGVVRAIEVEVENASDTDEVRAGVAESSDEIDLATEAEETAAEVDELVAE